MIVDSYINLIDKFSNKVSWIKEHFGKYPYNEIKRYGDDSSTDYMDLTYDEIEVNDCFYIKQNNKVRKIVITAKLKYILFYTILNTKICGYIDCDASSNDPNYFYKAVPRNTIYPIKVIVPSWIDISTWNLHYETEIVHV